MVHNERVRHTAIVSSGRELCIQRRKSHRVNATTYGHAQLSPATLEVPSVPASLQQSGFELIVRDRQARLLAVPPGVAPCRSRGGFPQADDIASPHKRSIKVHKHQKQSNKTNVQSRATGFGNARSWTRLIRGLAAGVHGQVWKFLRESSSISLASDFRISNPHPKHNFTSRDTPSFIHLLITMVRHLCPASRLDSVNPSTRINAPKHQPKYQH
jgi:hypothetical protein